MDLVATALNQMLNMLDSSKVSPTTEQKYYSFLVMKNLDDMFCLGCEIVNEITSQVKPSIELPDVASMNFCRIILEKLYNEDVFIEKKKGVIPNWKEVIKFDSSLAESSYKIYMAIKRNVVDGPESKQIIEAIKKKERKYFVQNFESIFKNIPFPEGLSLFKNILACPEVTDEQEATVWDFFQSLLDIYLNEKDNLEELSDDLKQYLKKKSSKKPLKKSSKKK